MDRAVNLEVHHEGNVLEFERQDLTTKDTKDTKEETWQALFSSFVSFVSFVVISPLRRPED
jgi:hypothetical protein